ncbi:cold shock domain-containing protein [Aquimarina celericrescens]|uniref:Cold shock domain-containing protein n=1 Tax=Aquimarina celericrescens TaxID=1964542 RepID=A0ABW5AT99_9FLAO|nr:cold shock domain-containing protein [Aquimarina celericrescens]
MIDLDSSEAKMKEIYSDIVLNKENITSEEDSKIQCINRILNECLAWNYKDFRAENNHENGFSDYILVNNDKPVLLIEAKRKGLIEVDTAEKEKVRYLKISGTSLKKAIKGIDQAFGYASLNGLPLSVVTDGFVWIVFKTFTPGENFKTKEAIVFPSLEAIVSNFSKFYDLLSKNQFDKKLYNAIFDEIHNKRLLLTQNLQAPLSGLDIKVSQKSEIAFDLDKIFSNFFSKLAGEENEDLLIECFVETKESRIADFSLEKITTSVLGNILPQDKDVDEALANLIQTNVETESTSTSIESGQTIFIVGPTGAGKSTFLDRFFRKTLPSQIRKKCALIKVNCLDATGREETALAWVTEKIIDGIENQIYENGSPSWDELLGLYHGQYIRRSNGVDAELYKKDKSQFKIKFGEFLAEKVENDREGYLKRILLDVVVNRKMLPIILVDNSDEFTNEYKQKLFQFTQALRRNARHCLLIFPVTDKSAWSFSKTDIFGIYKSRSFFLPTPSPREVFRKRIDFIKQKLDTDGSDSNEKGKYFSSRGITISIKDLNGFAKVLENVFVDNDYTSKTIGELTNYNIRRTLSLSQRVITSSVIEIDDLIRSYLSGEPLTTDFAKFMEALMRGNYELYKQGDNHEVYPIFQVDSKVRQSPLLNLRILILLDTLRKSSNSIEEKHLNIKSIIDYFDAIGCSETAVDKALLSLLEAGLVEPFDLSIRDLTLEQKLAISYRGIVHLRLAVSNSVFFYQMALTTAITDEEIALRIRSKYKSGSNLADILKYVKKEFYDYLISEDQQFINIENELEQYDCQRDLLINLKKFTSNVNSANQDLVATHGHEYQEGYIKEEVVAIVDFYDDSKGFGFVDVEEISDRVFLHANKLQDCDVETIKDGDSILCDISRNKKGFYVEKIHFIEASKNGIEVYECQIIRLFSDRGYGFVQLKDSDKTAFFHFSVFSVEDRDSISLGQILKAEVGPDKRTGDGYQVKHILESGY